MPVLARLRRSRDRKVCPPMKVAILSREPKSYSTRRLIDSAVQLGHKVRVYDTLRFSLELAQQAPGLLYRGKPLGAIDAVIPRVGASITYFGTAVVRQFEQMGTFCTNSALAITNSRDKLKSLQVLSKHDIGIPPTTFVRDRQDVAAAIDRVGGAPVIIKVLEGIEGIGFTWFESRDVVRHSLVQRIVEAYDHYDQKSIKSLNPQDGNQLNERDH